MRIAEGDGAFYGPKIDFVLTDSLKESGSAAHCKQILICRRDWMHLM
jgi:threonyl-tRNA synthetase